MWRENEPHDSKYQSNQEQELRMQKPVSSNLCPLFNRKSDNKTINGNQLHNNRIPSSNSIALCHCMNHYSASHISTPNSSASIVVDITPNGKNPQYTDIADEEPNPETVSPNPSSYIRNRLNLLASRNLLHLHGHPSSEHQSFMKLSTADIVSNIPDLQYNETAVQDMVISKLSMSTQLLPDTIEEVRKRDPEVVSRALVQTLEENSKQKSVQYWSQIELKEIERELSTDLCNGLEEQKAQNLLENKYGPNTLQKEKHDSVLKIFLNQFTSLVIILLLIAGIVSLAFQEWVEGAGILLIVLINATLATYMENSASTALAKLADLSTPKCTVVREGEISIIPAHLLIPGDVVLLRTGDSVPADVRLIEAMEVKCNEALLTGEPEDVSKGLKNVDLLNPFPTNLCFASTAVTNGTGKAVVVLTGMNTQIGRIAQQLKLAQNTSNNSTPLQVGLNRLGGFIGFMSLLVLIIIVIIALLTNYSDPTHPNSNPVFSIILVAVGFAVSSIPEGLPMVVTICLSIGCSEMCRRKANIRKLPAVETLGCCSVICSDKTGTLTEGKMTAVKLATFTREERKLSTTDKQCNNIETGSNIQNQGFMTSVFSFYPTRGFDPNGGVFEASSLTQKVKEDLLNLASKNINPSIHPKYKNLELNRSDCTEMTLLLQQMNYNDICTDYGSPINSHIATSKCVRTTLLAGYLNSYGTVLNFDSENNTWSTRGNMSEGALIVAAAKASLGLYRRKHKESPKIVENFKYKVEMNPNVEVPKVKNPVNCIEMTSKVHKNMANLNQSILVESTASGNSPETFNAEEYTIPEVMNNFSIFGEIYTPTKFSSSNHIPSESRYERISVAEVPFTSTRKMMMTVHALPTENRFGDIYLGNINERDVCCLISNENIDCNSNKHVSRTVDNFDSESYTHIVIIKGAPDKLVEYTGYILKTFKYEKSSFVYFDCSDKIKSSEKAEVEATNKNLSNEALRVLAIAILPLTSKDYLELVMEESSDKRLQNILEKRELILLGLVGFLDPPRPGVEKAITKCCEAGVRVIMITGDQQPTACAIAKSIGLLADENLSTTSSVTVDAIANHTVTSVSGSIVCSQLHEEGDSSKPHLSDDLFDEVVSSVNVFCRAQPEDKIAIVRSLQRQGEVVAMTGDGVNDAPALKAADIGVAMGISGTEVAKGASEMVLLDDNFVTIVNAIEEGRKIYSNVQKFVAFLLGTNIGEIVYLSVAIAAQLPIPIAALQILFLNLMSDGSPAVALSVDPPDPDMMKVPPRPKKSPIMTRDWWLFGNIPHAIFEAACVLVVLVIAMYTSLGVFRRGAIESLCHHGDGERYYCQTHEWRFGAFNSNSIGWVTNIDFFNPLTNQMEQIFGAAMGKSEVMLSPNEIPYVWQAYNEAEKLGIQCKRGVNGWCIPPAKLLSDEYLDLVAFGTIRGRTASFITAVFCEMLRAYTVRTWDWFIYALFNNPWLHFACSLSASSTLIVTFTPGLQHIFGTFTIYWWQYILAIGMGFLNMFFDELVPKPLYRSLIKRRRTRAKMLAQKDVQIPQVYSQNFLSIFNK
ncbi:E1-E2 ATPase family protein [Cryptosporidium andersoni]|uniref:P-type sodium-transporting ATPase4 n=1 Tax=Cryptosporidium andersoni TaxID=117008 RepID=A0A1J4MXB3_9CRYT|nr:E1-E2 ATPase family protein [Cryptosporidium andersoni]